MSLSRNNLATGDAPLSGPQLSLGQCVSLACLLEVTAPKVGNVHRGSDFADLTFADFLASSVAITPVLEGAVDRPLGETILQAIQATQQMVGSNTNLGIVLLLAPLAKVPREQDLAAGVAQVLASLTPADSELVYEAIRLAKPGGLGKVEKLDVAAAAPPHLLDAMQSAAERDLIAQQYVTNFSLVFTKVLPYLLDGQEKNWSLTDRIIRTQLRLLNEHPDSLIARKSGLEVAEELASYAGQVLAMGEPGDEVYFAGLADLDFWLRSDEKNRNPGTTADLIAAGLFAGLRDGLIAPPFN